MRDHRADLAWGVAAPSCLRTFLVMKNGVVRVGDGNGGVLNREREIERLRPRLGVLLIKSSLSKGVDSDVFMIERSSPRSGLSRSKGVFV